MTAAELEEYLRTAIGSYADSHVAAGDWRPEEALERYAAEFVSSGYELMSQQFRKAL